MASERNPFPQDLEVRERTGPRRSQFCENIVMLCTGLVGALSFALVVYIVAFHNPFGYGYDNASFNQSRQVKVLATNLTGRSVTVASNLPATFSFNVSENQSMTDHWTTTTEPWIAETSSVPTTVSTTVPTTVSTTVQTDVTTSTTGATVPTVAAIIPEPTTMKPITSTLAPPPPTTATIPPRSATVNFLDFGSYVAEDDEYDRPMFMGKAPWYWCVPRFTSLEEYIDKQWMCNRCHADALAGIYKIDDFITRDYEYWCFKLCFINPDMENCAAHLNQTQPRPSPDSARDCRFCNEQERHRKPNRLFV